jgi:hypothetical protein
VQFAKFMRLGELWREAKGLESLGVAHRRGDRAGPWAGGTLETWEAETLGEVRHAEPGRQDLRFPTAAGAHFAPA